MNNTTIQFGRQIYKLDNAFLRTTPEYNNTPAQFMAKAKIKKHIEVTEYNDLLKAYQNIIADCRKKFGSQGVTKVISEILSQVK